MLIDYYSILGVSEHATIDTIKSAYRQRAMQCHPDRGGSHEQMLLVNEAWGILSNTDARSQYDYTRAHSDDVRARSAATINARHAREKAARYPRQWADFSAWLDQSLADELVKLGGSGAGFAARFLPTETFSVSLETSASASETRKSVFRILSRLGRLTNEFSNSSSGPQLAAVIGSGFFQLNPTIIQVSVVPKSDCSSTVSIFGAAKEGLLKQNSAEKAVRRVERELRSL